METAREKLMRLVGEENLDNLDDYLTFFTQATNEEEFVRLMNLSGKRYGAGFSQVVGSKFERLYSESSEVREKVHEKLKDSGLSVKVIDEYFTKEAHITSVYLVVSEKMKNYLSDEQIKKFVSDSKQIMLDCIREYLKS